MLIHFYIKVKEAVLEDLEPASALDMFIEHTVRRTEVPKDRGSVDDNNPIKAVLEKLERQKELYNLNE